MDDYQVAAFYKFVDFPDFRDWRAGLLDVCQEHEVKGSLLLASEGINGTLAGRSDALRAVLDFLRRDSRFEDLVPHKSRASAPPFERLKVLLKREIVTMGVPQVDPTKHAGTYIEPEDWNELLEDPDVVVVDTRNDYEVRIGSFRGAVNPKLKSFREFPEWLRANFANAKHPKVAMFCTGGIRCEKSTAFLKQEGVKDVFHLKGGILNYLEQIPEEESLWEGECFVFDQRVAVGVGLQEGQFESCCACGEPVDREERRNPLFIEGVQCSRCHTRTSAAQKKRFRARFECRKRTRERQSSS